MEAPVFDLDILDLYSPPQHDFILWDMTKFPNKNLVCVLLGDSMARGIVIPHGLILLKVLGETEVYERVGILSDMNYTEADWPGGRTPPLAPVPTVWNYIRQSARRVVTIV